MKSSYLREGGRAPASRHEGLECDLGERNAKGRQIFEIFEAVRDASVVEVEQPAQPSIVRQNRHVVELKIAEAESRLVRQRREPLAKWCDHTTNVTELALVGEVCVELLEERRVRTERESERPSFLGGHGALKRADRAPKVPCEAFSCGSER